MNRELLCHEESRRARVRAEAWNGFDYLEVEEIGTRTPGQPCMVMLRIYLLGKDSAPAGALDGCQFIIEGGRRVPRVVVEAAKYVPGAENKDDTIVLTVPRPNDLSTYTLRLVRNPHPGAGDDLINRFDPRYTALDFTFAAGCPSDLDCAQLTVCPPEPLDEPAIDYLARDYAALRRLLLDRLALIMPEWKRRAIPDLGVALVEVLAYTGDRISYHQDAVATEAYLGTARKRISLRRHARLVDYLMHEGCNARAFVCLKVSADALTLGPEELERLSFLTAKPLPRSVKGRTTSSLPSATSRTGEEVFLPICPPRTLDLSASDIYDWSTIIDLVRTMLPSAVPAAPPEKKYTGKHHPTLDKTWPMLPDARRTQLRGEGFDPRDRELQGEFEPWIKEHSPWAALSDAQYSAELQELCDRHFDPLGDEWVTEWDKWSQFARLWSTLPNAVQTTLRNLGFEPKGEALGELTDRWFTLLQIGLRLPANLREQLAGKVDPHDLGIQSALLAGLNRALHDRGLAHAEAGATDETVMRSNRHLFQGLFGDALALPGSLRLYSAHNEIRFYTWGNAECCLPRGATHATLAHSDALHLRVGDVLIFEEVLGPTTGLPGDANPAHRHPVLLTRVVPGVDALYDQPIVEIEWAAEDALPFPLCLSVRAPADGVKPCAPIENVSVARGNAVLADHGRRIDREPIGKVPLDTLAASCRCEGEVADPVTHPGRFTPELAKGDLAFAEAPAPFVSAARALVQNPRRAVPCVQLTSIAGDPTGESPHFGWEEYTSMLRLAARLARASQAHAADATKGDPSALHLIGRLPAKVRAWLAEPETAKADVDPPKNDLSNEFKAAVQSFVHQWTPKFDLLASEAGDLHFVVEMDDSRKAQLRFGFDGMGRTPEAGSIFSATYRVGSPLAGNVGADHIADVWLGNAPLDGVTARNPLPASGATVPESLEDVRRKAPFVFHRQLERAITAEDYTQLAMQCPHARVQRAATDLRWTGSRHLARVAIDPLDQAVAPPALLAEIKKWLDPRRRIGHEVEVVTATLVPLSVALRVCVLPHYQPAHVKQALLEVFSSGLRPNGARGFFHPDQLTFGEPIRLSTIAATAQAVPGVANVEVRELQRLFSPPNHELDNGVLPLGPLEIAQLENDPTFPEHGVLTIQPGGAQ